MKTWVKDNLYLCTDLRLGVSNLWDLESQIYIHYLLSIGCTLGWRKKKVKKAVLFLHFNENTRVLNEMLCIFPSQAEVLDFMQSSMKKSAMSQLVTQTDIFLKHKRHVYKIEQPSDLTKIIYN